VRGRAEVHRLRTRLDSVFERAARAGAPGDEVLADLARYLYVLVLGFVEASVKVLVTERCRRAGDRSIGSYAIGRVETFRNPNAETLLQLVGSFDPGWRDQLGLFMAGPRKDALDSVYALRNQVAHGNPQGGSLGTIREYYAQILEVVEELANIFDPMPPSSP
jgi:hypothetical protein